MLTEATNRIDYEQILFNWENSKEDFLLWLKYVCGISDKDCCRISNVLVDMISIKEWIELCFDGNFDNVLETVKIYQLSKVA